MVKKNDFNKKFKIAVERNFDQSAGIYDSFEVSKLLRENCANSMRHSSRKKFWMWGAVPGSPHSASTNP
jgi:hypothetical protein